MEGIIPLAPSRRKRFYEPVILLDSLRAVYRKENKVTEPDLEATAGKSPKQIFFCFVNKLGQICDNQPSQPLGKTVTSFVLLDSGTIEYRFASNQRDGQELNKVKKYIVDILNILGGVDDEVVNDKTLMAPIFSNILRMVLAFNRPRIEKYIGALCDQNNRLMHCIDTSAEEGLGIGKSVSQALRGLQTHIDAAMNTASDNNDEFARHAQELLQEINTHYGPTLEEYLKQKTRGVDTVEDSPWSEVRHALGRLLSYFIAIKVLISARKLWPQIFVDFEVEWIPSTEPSLEPPEIRRNAKGIIDRMGRNRATMEAYQRHANDLQGLGLDNNIKDRVHHTKFRPIVHAEINLLDSIMRDEAQAYDEDEDPPRFFNEAEFGRYIGSSKPTCMLCHWYFAAHTSGVQCRSSHGNLYYNWRTPDVLETDGAEADQERNGIIESMIKAIREETSRAIKKRTYSRRKHDSRDTPSGILFGTIRGHDDDFDDLASRLSRTSLGGTDSSQDTSFSRAGAIIEEE
ncbi:hypothetical protein MMYC01_209159 [Madurella mycetomatis]|uniref:Uncharacterized protein n=1 Tax=Madurella mycetomatis TaxID=100816 RepID=A0A175VVI0_9PEZI|nr:hypothetical protein MMYC01_209159 [Madurella mycetomatis]